MVNDREYYGITLNALHKALVFMISHHYDIKRPHSYGWLWVKTMYPCCTIINHCIPAIIMGWYLQLLMVKA